MSTEKLNLELSLENVNTLVILLELAEREIHRNFKNFNDDDMDLKEIYYNYRYSGRTLRRRLKELRGY